MKEKIYLETKIGWGVFNIIPPISFMLFMTLIYYSYHLFIAFDKILFILFLSAFFPILYLNYISIRILKSHSKNYSDLRISSLGIYLNKKRIKWKDIKSISFNTGRFSSSKIFYMKKFVLPAFQEIYILDNKGREYHSLIDIDYNFKKDRYSNNLVNIKDKLLELDMITKLSDWAQKR